MKNLFRIISYCYRRKSLLFFSGIVVLLFCEIYNQLPFLPQRLEYQPDEELISVLRPNQIGYQWLGNMSYKSPLITINSDGHRGKETNWTNPVILATGNSEAMGCGVKDDEVWTACLEKMLHITPELKSLQIVNSAHPGYGPYHHFIRIQRAMMGESIRAIIVRVDLADRYFKRVSEDQIKKALDEAKNRQRIRDFSKGIPFLSNKIQAQISSIKENLTLFLFRKGGHQGLNRETDGIKFWDENQIWWNKIALLAKEKNAVLIFLVYDFWQNPGMDIVVNGLKSISDTGNLYILKISPSNFGISERISTKKKDQLTSELFLKRDPHASSLQHELIAKTVYNFIMKSKQLIRNNYR